MPCRKGAHGWFKEGKARQSRPLSLQEEPNVTSFYLIQTTMQAAAIWPHNHSVKLRTSDVTNETCFDMTPTLECTFEGSKHNG
jgi:hypothetical protein